MKARKVGKNRERRLPTGGFAQQARPYPIEGRQLLRDFNDSDQSDFRAIGDEFDPSFAHALPAHPEKLDVGAGPQCRREPGGVHVAGRFARGNQNLCGRHRFESTANAQITGAQIMD